VATERRVAAVRGTALLCAAVILAVTTLSAFVRLSNAAADLQGIESDAVLAARAAHRIAASSALLLVIGLVGLSLGPRPFLQREGRHALALLALVAFLAVLGRWSAGTVAPAIVLGNLLGGFLLFALCWRIAWPVAPILPDRAQPLAALAVVVVLVQVALGGLSHPAHPYGAVVVLAAVGSLAVALWRAGRRGLAELLVVLLASQLALGAAHLAAGSPPGMVLAHNVVALLLLASLLRVVRLSWLE
jgi:heme a synthase